MATKEAASREQVWLATPLGMPRLRDAVDSGDDWTGITNSAKRRRLQNRLNQRALRRRDREGRTSKNARPEAPPQKREIVQERQCTLSLPAVQAALDRLRRRAYMEYRSQTPRPSSLSFLVQINVLDALTFNAAVLGLEFLALCDGELISPFNMRPSWSLGNTPPSLAPTQLQESSLHHPWLDLFPFPRMRDNIFRCLQHIDEDELCKDLVDFCEADGEKPMLLVWGEASNPWSWEMTPAFLSKWGFLVRECTELVEATNYWRERRGDETLVFSAIPGM